MVGRGSRSDPSGAASSFIAAELLPQRVRETAATEGPDAAAALIGIHWDRYATTAPDLLLEAIRALPGEVFVENVGMVVAARYLRHVVAGGDPGRFQHDPRLAAGAPREGGALGEDLILLTGSIATGRTTGQLEEALDAVERARRRLAEAPATEVSAIRANLPHLRFQWARALEAADDDSAQAEYEEIVHMARETEQPQIARRAGAHLAWRLADRGHLNTGERWLERARATGEPSPRYDAPLHLASALLNLERRDFDASRADLGRLTPDSVGDMSAAALWVRAWLADTPADQALVDADLAHELQRLPALAGVNRRYVGAARLRLEQSVPEDPHSPDEHTIAAISAYRRGDLRLAASHADPALQVGAGPRSQASAAIVAAAAAHALGRARVAREEFSRAHALIEHERMYTRYELIAREHLDELARATPSGRITVPLRAETRVAAARLALLTRRERQVLILLASGDPFSAIAADLFISPNTLKATTARLYRKLGVNSRAQAAEVAHESGLLAEASRERPETPKATGRRGLPANGREAARQRSAASRAGSHDEFPRDDHP